MSAALRSFPQPFVATSSGRSGRGSAEVHELGLRHLRVRPSWICLLLMLPPVPLMALGWQRQSIWLSALGLALLALIGLSLWRGVSALLGLRLRLPMPAPCFAGDTAMLELRLDNPGPRDRRDLAVSQDGVVAQGWVDVAPFSGNLALVPLPTQLRGLWPVPALTVTSQHPMSLFHVSARWQPEVSLLVFPRPALGRGEAPSRPPRPAHGSAPLWLDLSGVDGGCVEDRLSRLVSRVLQAERSEQHYGLRLGPVVVPPRRGYSHRRRCLELLSLHPGELSGLGPAR